MQYVVVDMRVMIIIILDVIIIIIIMYCIHNNILLKTVYRMNCSEEILNI